MEKARIVIKNLLLAFVLISIGFALGKEVTIRRLERGGGSVPRIPEQSGDKIVVYYLHATFRCVTCNEIERLARTLVETEFAEELAAGRIEWREADFQLDKTLAERYDVVSSCLVVADVRNGRDEDYQRLDEVWTRYEKPAEFNEYVGSAIRKYLNREVVE